MLQLLKIALRERLAASAYPVERDIADLLDGASVLCEGGAFRIQRYHRKIDVARRVMAAYDDRIDKATTAQTVSRDGYLGLTLVFIEAARREPGCDETSRARLLRWVNSAFNCMDRIEQADRNGPLGEIDLELQALLRKGSQS